MSRAIATKPKLMTAEEFYDWAHRPENEHKWFDLVRGELIELPPTVPHGVVSANAVRILGNYTFKRRKGYVANNDTGVIVERDPDTVRGPDVALYEDIHAFDELPRKYAANPPRLTVEVLSPSDRADQVMHKVTYYLRNGVELVWLIDPESRMVTVYRSDKGPRVYTENEELSGEEILPGFRCRVADFFYLPGQAQELKGKPSRRRRHRS